MLALATLKKNKTCNKKNCGSSAKNPKWTISILFMFSECIPNYNERAIDSQIFFFVIAFSSIILYLAIKMLSYIVDFC